MLSRALSILIASGVLLAGSVLWQVTRDRRIRVVVAGLSAYAAAGFVHAAVTGLTLAAALARGGLLSALPRLLQGAVISAVVILPLGWVASVVRAGIPRFREGSRRRAAYQATALSVVLALVMGSLPRLGASEGERAATRGIRLDALESSLRALADGDRASPRDRWDPSYVVETIGRQPDALFEWVRANTRWIPYRGRLRGAAGVLMDRDGNSLDRSILVATLFRAAGHPVRLAHAALPPAMAADLVDLMASAASPRDLLASSRSGTPSGRTAIPDGSVAIRTLSAQYRLDDTAITRDIGETERALDRFRSDLTRRVSDQTARLLATVVRRQPAEELKQRRVLAASALSDHWWVQVERDGRWIDCDLLAGGRMGQSLATATDFVALDGIPRELNHAVVMRVIAEYQSRSNRREETILEYSVIPADSGGRSYVLQLWPTAWPSEVAHTLDGRFGVKAAALEQHQWTAVLTTDEGKPVAHGVIGDSPPPAHANAFTGLADAFSSQMTTGTHEADLTAVWIEYETHAPDRDRQVVRRALFDLQAAARERPTLAATRDLTESDRLTRSLALMMQTEILVVGCHLAPEWIAHMASESAASTQPLLRSLASAKAPLERDQLIKQVAAARRSPSPLYLLATSRVGWATDDDPVVMDRPNVLTRHRYPRLAGNELWLASAFDIVINEVATALNVDDEFRARLRQGVIDTNLEALLSGDRAASNTADAYADQRDWITVTSADRAVAERLPLKAEGRLAILQDLDRGYVVIAASASRQNDGAIGWWRVHATTGDTLGRGANGWGMGPEDSALFNMVVSAARGFTFEYGLCQGFPAGINLLRYLNDSYFDSWHPNWTTYNRSRSAADVFDENNTRCLISAIAMGVVATLPILLITLKAHYMRLGLGLAEKVAAEEVLAEQLKTYYDDLLQLPGMEGPMPMQVRTQVWRDAGYTDTLVPRPPPGWRADPAQILARENSIRAAEGAMTSAQKELNLSMREYLEYLNGRKPIQYGGRLLDPSYDPEVLAALRARAELDFDRYADTVDQLKKLDPSRTGGWGGGGGAPPPPKPIGNNNITQDAQVVGAAGAKGALGK